MTSWSIGQSGARHLIKPIGLIHPTMSTRQMAMAPRPLLKVGPRGGLLRLSRDGSHYYPTSRSSALQLQKRQGGAGFCYTTQRKGSKPGDPCVCPGGNRGVLQGEGLFMTCYHQ